MAYENDMIKDVLEGMRLEQATPYTLELRAPWGIEIPNKYGFIACYYVSEGRCWFELEDKVVGWIDTGDILVILSGAPYTLRYEKSAETRPLCTVDPKTGLKRVADFGTTGALTRLVIIALRIDREMTNPLLLSLPGWIALTKQRESSSDSLVSTISALQQEFDTDAPGSPIVVSRLGEILLAQILRSLLKRSTCCGEADKGFLRGVADPNLGKALLSMHQDPRHSWTVAALAQKAGMSRTAFATSFSALVGVPPSAYLRRLRMYRACAILRDTREGVEAVADLVGYASEAAFSRTFKKEVGVSPATWRKRQDTRKGG